MALSINLPSFLRMGAVLAIAVTLAGCGRSESYRYKLTLALDTPDGVKKASSVVEISFWEVSIPARGTMHRLNGEALYLDLGPGRRPLVALLMYTSNVRPYKRNMPWGDETGPAEELLSRFYGPIGFNLNEVARVSRMRGAHRITSNDLPVLVTFADVDDPASVTIVDPNELEATLGAGVSWNEITLEITDEPITTGIEQKMPWLAHYYDKNLRLDGSDHGAVRKLSNELGWECFVFSNELRKRPQHLDLIEPQYLKK
jgi:hypothetical protein